MATPFTPQDNQGNSQKFNSDGSVILDVAQVTQATNPDLAFGDDQRLRIGLEHILLYDPVDGAAINANIWAPTSSTLTGTQAAGQITLNAGSSATAAAYYLLTSRKVFPRFTEFPLYGQGIFKFAPTNGGVYPTGVVMEFGLFNASGATAIVTDGILLRINAAGVAQIVQSYNGQEAITNVVVNTDNVTAWVPNPNYWYVVELTLREAKINLDIQQLGGEDVVNMEVVINYTHPAQTSINHLPACARIYNLTAPAVAGQLWVGAINVQQMDVNSTKPWSAQMSSSGKAAYQAPLTAFGQTANWSNSAAPTTRSLSNTTPGETTLGGLTSWTPTTTADTDYVLFGYQVPSGYDLFITDIVIDNTVAGAANPATALAMEFALGINATAVSLATADSVSTPPYTLGPRRVALGQQVVPASAAIGTQATGGRIVLSLVTPLQVNSGDYVTLIMRAGQTQTATASEVIRTSAYIGGYFE
jgi:hypothetical protein